MSKKEINYGELIAGSFFNEAMGIAQSANSVLSSVNISENELAGQTAIEAFSAHKCIMNKMLGINSEDLLYGLYLNTSQFLSTIGVTFSDIDDQLAAQINKER